jgi:hypothetical protein
MSIKNSRPLLLWITLPAMHAQDSATHADWPSYGGTHAAWRYSSLDQANRDNGTFCPLGSFRPYAENLHCTPIVCEMLSRLLSKTAR